MKSQVREGEERGTWWVPGPGYSPINMEAIKYLPGIAILVYAYRTHP